MEVEDIEKVERRSGVASTVKADELIPVYTEGVQRFLRDNQSAMGDDWVRMAAGRLYNFSGENEQGDVLGSSTDMGVAIATFCPDIPLITGQQLLRLYAQAGNKNPFGDVYVDFGVWLNGNPKINPMHAQILLNDLSNREIQIGEGKVVNLSQLGLIAHQEAGLVYRLAEDVSQDDVVDVSAFPFYSTGRSGLFGACLYWGAGWGAGVGGLGRSGDTGRVVRYDAEGVARAEPRKPSSDLIDSLTHEFMKKF